MSYYRSISCHGRTIRQKKLFIYNEQLCIKINNCQVAVTTRRNYRADNFAFSEFVPTSKSMTMATTLSLLTPAR